MRKRVRILCAIGAATCLVAMTGAFIVMVAIAAHLTGRINEQQQASNHNRVVNVLTWCHAINTDRATTRGYVNAVRAKDPAVPALALPSLPCSFIAHRTEQSSH